MLAIAFPAGWLLCRAWLQAGANQPVSRRRLNELLQAQQDRYRRRIQVIQELFKRNEAAHQQELDGLRSAVADAKRTQAKLEQELEQLHTTGTDTAQSAGTPAQEQHDTGLLRIERDELLARIQRLQDELDTLRQQPSRQQEAAAADKAARGELREQLNAREQQLRELTTRLEHSELRAEELAQEVESWKRRLAPLTVQLRKQRELLRLAHDTAEQTQPHKQPVAPPAANQTETPDELQKIRGIGPALERRLRAQGILRYSQLAQMSEPQLAELATRLAISANLPARDEWVEQARELAQGAAVAEDEVAAAGAGSSRDAAAT